MMAGFGGVRGIGAGEVSTGQSGVTGQRHAARTSAPAMEHRRTAARLASGTALSTGVVAALLMFAPMPAFAGGGSAGNGIATGVDNATSPGGNGGSSGVVDSGGGGGAGTTGGNGGNGRGFNGGIAGTGGTGGSTPGAAGGAGTAAQIRSAGGGGGGGGAHGGVGTGLPGATRTGGNGGRGGDALIDLGLGGGGGAGGWGYVVTGTGGFGTLSSAVTGGTGGAGGNGTARGGNGGSGGTGLFFSNAGGGTVFIGASVTGGAGGARGTTSGVTGTDGAGGVGIIGQNLSITLNSTVSGGLSGNGVTRANAINFTGGTNSLTLGAGFGITGGIDITGGLTITPQAGGSTLSNIISGSGSLTKAGAGTLTLSGANTFSGGTTVSEGTLAFSAGTTPNFAPVTSGPFGTGAITMAAGTSLLAMGDASYNLANDIVANGAVTIENGGAGFKRLHGVISGPGQVTVRAQSGGVTLGGENTFSGGLVIGARTNVILGSPINGSTTGTLGGAGGSVTFTDAQSNLGLNRLNAFTIDNVFVSSVNGAGTITKSVAGTVTLTGNSPDFSGTFSLTAGTLQIGNGGTSGSLGTARIGINTALELNRSDTFTVANVISGLGTLTQLGTGTAILSGANTYTGLTTVSAGTLNVTGSIAGNVTVGGTGRLLIGNSDAIGGTITTTGSTIAFANGVNETSALIISSATTNLEVAGTDTATQSGVISSTGVFGFNKIGTGTLTLSGANTYSGLTTISAGTLSISAANNLGDGSATNALVINGGMLRTTAGIGTTRTVTIGAAGGTINTVTADLTLNRAVAFDGQLIKTGFGQLALYAANTGAGGIRLDQGTLALFDNSTPGTGTITMAEGTTLSLFSVDGATLANAIVLGGGAGSIIAPADFLGTTLSGVLSGGQLNVTGNMSTVTLTGANTYGTTWVDSGSTLQVGNGGTTGTLGTGGVSLPGSFSELDFNRSDTFTVANVISGAGRVTQRSTGTTILTGANTFSGTTRILAGVLQIGNGGTAGNLGTGNIVNDGRLVFNRSDDVTLANVMSGAGAFTKLGAGTLTLTSAHTYTGLTTVSAGTLNVTGSIAGNVTVGGTGRLLIGSSDAIGGMIITTGSTIAYANGVDEASALIISSATTNLEVAEGGSATQSGVISSTGAFGFTKTGAGTLSLTGANTYSGVTTIAAGRLLVSASDNLGNGSATNSLTINGGTLGAMAGFSMSRGVTIGAAGGTIELGFNSPSLDGSMVFDGQLTKTGLGNLTLSGSNSGAGGLRIVQGAVRLLNTSTPGTGMVTMGNGTSLFFETPGRTFANDIALGLMGSSLIPVDFGSVTLSGVLSGGQLIVEGASIAVNLTGTNTYGATTVRDDSTLRIGIGGTTGTLGLGNVTLTSEGSRLEFNRSDTLTVTNVISGAGQVSQAGSGTTILTGANTFTGLTSVIAGRLLVNGSLAGGVTVASGGTLGGSGTITGPVVVNAGASLAPGQSPGTLTLGSLTLNAGSTTTFELATAGVAGGATNDLIRVTSTAGVGATGNLALNGGTISVVRGLGFTRGQYTLIQFDGALSGALGNLNLSALGGGFSGTLALGTGTLLLNVANSTENVWWNGSTTVPTGAVVGGTGTWNFTNENFTNAAGTDSGAWAGNGALVNFAGTAGTVTIAAGQTVAPGGLIFRTNGYVIAGGDAASRLQLTGATGIDTGAGVSATISAIISGPGSITKTGTGTLTLTAANTFTGLTTVSGGTLVNNGSLAGALTNAATVTNAGTISGLVTNQGTLTSTGTLGGGLANATAASIASVSGTLQGPVTNSGTLIVTGNLASNSTLTNSGTGVVTVAAGAAWTGLTAVTHSSTAASGFTINGSLANAGLFTNSTGSTLVVAAGGQLSPAGGLINQAGATVTNAGTITSSVAINNQGTVNSTGTIAGSLENLAGGVANLSGSIGSLSSNGTVNLLGNLSVGSSFVNQTNGRITVQAGQTLTVGGPIINDGTAAGAFTINGTVSSTSFANGTGARLVINAGGSLQTTNPVTAASSSEILNSGRITGRLVTRGLLVSTGELLGGLLVNPGGEARVSGVLNGTVDTPGSLIITGATSSNGANVATGITGRITVNAGAAWTGAGTILLNGTVPEALLINGQVSLGAGALVNMTGTTGARVAAGGSLTTVNPFTATGVSVSAGANFTNQGTVTSFADTFGTVANAGSWTGSAMVRAGGQLTNSGTWDASGTGGSVTVNGQMTNSGRLLGRVVVTTSPAATPGRFVNTATGVVETAATLTPSDIQFGATVVNEGRWNGALTVGQFGTGTLTNSGTINGAVTIAGGGVLQSTGSLLAGLSNAGTATLAGTVTGAVTNSGTISLSGLTAGIGDYSQTSTGRLNLNGFNTSLGSLAGAGTIALGGSTLTVGTNGASTTYGGGFSGTGSLIKTGTGTLTLSGQSSAAFTTTVAQGTLVYERPAAGGVGGTTVLNGATLLLQSSIPANFTAGQLTLAGTGVGGLGALRVRASNATDITSSLSSIVLAADTLISLEAGRMLFSGITGAGRTLTLQTTGTATVSGLSTGTGGLIKTGTGELIIAGTNSYVGDTSVQAGLVTIAGNGVVAGRLINAAATTNLGQLNGLAINAGQFINSGQALGGVFNTAGATFTSTGTVAGGLTNEAGATASAAGTVTGSVSNAGAFTVTGNLASNDALTNSGTGVVRVNAGSAWSGLTGITNSSTAPAGITVEGTLATSGLVTNGAGSFLTVAAGGVLNAGSVSNAEGGLITVQAGGTFSHALTNAGLVSTAGASTADLTNAGAQAIVSNEASGVWSGQVLANRSGAAILNAGRWTGNVLANTATLGNLATGTWTGTLANGAGGIVLNAGLWSGELTNGGELLNDAGGRWNGAATNAAGAVLVNRGSWTGAASNAGTLAVRAGGTWSGNLTNLATGTALIEGRLTGTVTNAAGGSVSNSGIVDGAVTNAGLLVSTGTLTSGLANTGEAGLAGTVSGAITNSGTLTVTANLASNSTLANTGTGVVGVVAGASWSGLTGITNSSRAAAGLNIAGTLTTGGLISNGAGATIVVQSGGRLVASGIDNAATGTIVVLAGGTVIDDLNNAGAVSNAGSWTAGVNNTGAGASLANLAGATWTGNLLTNTGGALVTNQGQWTGTAGNAARLLNAAGATWTGALTNLAGGQTDNGGTWAGTVSNAGVFQNLAGGAVTGAVTNTATLLNAGTLSGGLTNATGGTASTTGVISGGLTNSGTVAAQGAINGAITNQASGLITVTGALTGTGMLTNGGAAQLLVTGGNLTGLAAITNSSTNATGIGIAATRSLAAGTLTNAAGATVVNQGILTTTGGVTNSGLLGTSGTLNGPLANQASGQVQAQGSVNGAVTNAGQFVVTAALASTGGAFSNQASGQLINLGSAYTGLGAISNAAGGRIFLGNGITNASLAGVSLANAGAIEMMNARVGDQLVLSGTYTGTAGSRLSMDVNMAQNSNLADRVVAAGFSGTTTLSLQNIGAGRIYFSTPIVLVSGAGAGTTFVAATDASTQAVLASNGVIDYALRPLPDGSSWGLVANLNTDRASSVATQTQAVTALADFGLGISAEALVAGAPADGQWTMRVWGRMSSASQDVTATALSSDPFATSGEIQSRMTTTGFRVGGSVRLLTGPAGSLDVGASGGRTEGKTTQMLTGQVTRFEMPSYGVHAVFTGSWLRADIRHDVLDLEIDPANLVTNASLSGDGTRTSVGIGFPIPVTNGWIEPYARVERLRIDINSTSLTGGLGTLAFNTQEMDRYELGFATWISIPGQTWTVRPSLDVSVNQEDGAGASRFAATGGTGNVLIGTARDSVYLDADVGLSLIHNSSGLELFIQGTGRNGGAVEGQAVTVGARLQF